MEAKTRTLLVVDDEPELREILDITFSRKGYTVFQAGNAFEALEVLKINKIDLVISDVRMPGGDGLLLLEEIKRTAPRTPVVLFITGFADISFDEAYDKGVEAIFAKPFNTRALFEAVEKILENQDERWRATARSPSTFEIDLKYNTLHEAQAAHVLNVGRGGFFVRMAEGFPQVGEIISFRFVFGQDLAHVVKGEGRVKWVRLKTAGDLPSGCGVEFESLDKQARASFFELLNSLRTRQYIPKW